MRGYGPQMAGDTVGVGWRPFAAKWAKRHAISAVHRGYADREDGASPGPAVARSPSPAAGTCSRSRVTVETIATVVTDIFLRARTPAESPTVRTTTYRKESRSLSEQPVEPCTQTANCAV
jgi:hypothetical protein